MTDDIIIGKIETINLCIRRVKEEYIGYESNIRENYTKQDSIILNLERASQATINLSTHIIRLGKLGVPKTSRDVFEILKEHKLISTQRTENMKKMVGFRNLAVHDYQNISIDIVVNIVEKHLIDFEEFINEIIDA